MRIRRTPPRRDPPPPPPTPRAVRRALPPAGQLRRERRALLQLREQRLRDLGGLMLEMYRRDQFRAGPARRPLRRAAATRGTARRPRRPARRRRLPRQHPPVGPLRVRRADLLGLEVLPAVRPADRAGPPLPVEGA